jgi:hypothetical protein
MLAFFAVSIFPQAATVNMCGTVTDAGGKPLADVVVRLGQATYNNGYGQAPYLVSTDATGHYQLGTGTCNVNTVIPKSTLASGDAFSRPLYVGGKVLFSLPQATASVRMSIYTLAGRFVRDVMNSSLSKGNYSVSIDTRGISSQYYLLRVTINGFASTMRIQPAFHSTDGAIVQNSSEFQTRLEKLAAVVDTLHATLPGYTIGVTPVTALSGQNDFVLTKSTTWNGDTNAFWGDVSKYPTDGEYVILNRTNGMFPDSMIWFAPMGGTKIQLSKQSTIKIPNQGRFYIWIAPKDSVDGGKNPLYFDFVEQNWDGNSWRGNTTRVDGWRLPITFRIHTSTNHDTVLGDSYQQFFQSRKSKFDEFVNEVPKEFIGLATQDFANIYAPHTSPVNFFNKNGPYQNYFDAYYDSAIKANPSPTPPTTSTTGSTSLAFEIFACAGQWAGMPPWSAAMNRHIATTPSGYPWGNGQDYPNWRNPVNAPTFYNGAPCNYFSKWCHRRAINGKAYGFPYDDVAEQAAFAGVGNTQSVILAIGW